MVLAVADVVVSCPCCLILSGRTTNRPSILEAALATLSSLALSYAAIAVIANAATNRRRRMVTVNVLIHS